MNIDFHYYATYVAARLAGYDFDSAQTIAHSAQYVDDSDQSMLCQLGNYYIKDFTPVPTSQTKLDMIEKNFRWSEGGLRSVAYIWVPFHFLPGNYGANTDIKEYTGPRSDRGKVFSWTFDDESAKQFKLLCQPNSLLVKNIINDIVANHTGKDYTLHMAGLRMHVMADTWAHMYYIGIPQWFVNNAGDTVYKIDGQTKTKVKWQRVWPWGDATDFIEGEQSTPDMLAYNSLVYLGHGRMGHLPDYPWLEYQYRPQWSNADITKDNKGYFLQALKQMVKALECIKNKTVFDVKSYAQLPADTENVIKEILATKVNDQSETWVKNIGRIKVGGAALKVPEAYDKNKWLKEMLVKQSAKNTNYYYFNNSAVLHLNLVLDVLRGNNIYIYDIPRENIVTTKFKSKGGNYIGKMYKQVQYYPKMEKKAITIQIIKATPAPLKSGDIVEIKTVEKEVGEYSFLGAWMTTSLYYYTRAYSESKQKWMIEKIDTSVTGEIKDGDAVRFKNMYYKDKPYMCTYDYLWIGGTYLTTQAKGSEKNAIWIMEGLKQFNMLIITSDYFVSQIIDANTSGLIHNDMKTYGLIDENNNPDIRVLKTTLDNIGLGFIHEELNSRQKEQVWVQLEKVANSPDIKHVRVLAEV